MPNESDIVMKPLKLITPSHWTEYELIDTGDGEKLERFGKYILRRPEPQAVWNKSIPENEWVKLAHATFRRDKGLSKDTEKGEWVLKPGMPQQWLINYRYDSLTISMRLGLTAFKHVGIFPEQAENWNFIYETLRNFTVPDLRFLNLFAYTGGASLAAKAAGADVVHVDSVRQVVNWSAENMQASNLDGIRWVVEDAMKYVRREVKRGKTYHGIILDPPAYGRGPDGEKWILDDGINELFECCSKLLEKEQAMMVVNLYSMGFSALIPENLMKQHFQDVKNSEMGEIFLPDRSGIRLPLGVFLRFTR
jgi:23S rRNA (cytosine1962-C5)-methyltransferase